MLQLSYSLSKSLIEYSRCSKYEWAVLICSIHFGEATHFGALQRLWCEFTVKADQKSQGGKLVGINNMKNNLE